jgi:drug/metabolite transporter (DMT)-like permease
VSPELLNWVLAGVIVAATTAGELLQAMGMRHHGEIHDFRPGPLGRAAAALARNRYVAASFGAMAISFFAFLALVSVADLSFAVPATAASYVFETILARYVLGERIAWKRWAGASLVACGVALLSV